MIRTFVATLCLAAAVAQAAPASKWTITDVLPAWAGQAQAINNRGEVTGWMYGNSPIPGHVAFLYSSGELKNLGVPTGEFATQGFGMSNNGIVVGDTNQRPAVYANGQWTVVPIYGTLNDVNEAGAAVGAMRFPGKLDAQAALYKDGVTTNLGTIPGGSTWSFAWGINNSGTVVGYASLPTPPFSGLFIFHPFVYENGVMKDVGTLGGTSAYLYDINNSGTAVGGSQLANGQYVATTYSHGVLAAIPGAPANSIARAINERGDIIGSSDAGGWLMSRDGTLTLLAQLPEVRAAGYASVVPVAINDRGWIAGNGYKPAEGGVAFLLTQK